MENLGFSIITKFVDHLSLKPEEGVKKLIGFGDRTYN